MLRTSLLLVAVTTAPQTVLPAMTWAHPGDRRLRAARIHAVGRRDHGAPPDSCYLP